MFSRAVLFGSVSLVWALSACKPDSGLQVVNTAPEAEISSHATDLTLSWTSDLHGEFSTQGADTSGVAQFSTSKS